MKDAAYISIMICVFFIGMGLGILYPDSKPEPINPTYPIWEYHYDYTSIIRYRDHIAVYEYVSSGVHVVTVKDTLPISMNNQDEAIDFCRSYLADRKMEDRL